MIVYEKNKNRNKILKFIKILNQNAKIYKANIKKNNEKWFYIQVGNYFKDCFHIEYIELDKKNKASISCRIFKR